MARKKKTEEIENQEIFEITAPKEVVLEAVEELAEEAAPVVEASLHKPVAAEVSDEVISEAVTTEGTEAEVISEPAAPDEETASETAVETSQEEPAPTEAAESEAPAEAAQPEAEPTEATAPAESAESADSAPDIPDAEPEEPAEDDGKTHVSLSLPLEAFKQNSGSLDRLKAAISSKQTLLKKALATDDLSIQVDEEKVVFPWFTIQDERKNAEEVDAYTRLVLALARKALTQTRVSSEEKLNPDERLGMRLYLINLGFIGDEYKSARAVLMRNFSGSNAAQKFAEDFNLAMPEVHIGGKS